MNLIKVDINDGEFNLNNTDNTHMNYQNALNFDRIQSLKNEHLLNSNENNEEIKVC